MSRRLLLVDDEDDIREIVTISLERLGGWAVVAVDSGTAAVEAVGAGDRFDAILLDVMMPGLDGAATFRLLRRPDLAPDVPVVFLTAKVQDPDSPCVCGLGAQGVILKPFDPMTLSVELDRVLAQPVGRQPIAKRRPATD